MSDFFHLISEFNVLQGFLINIELTVLSAFFSLVLGTILTVMRISPAPSLARAAQAYTSFMINMPLTLVILACTLGIMGQLNISFSQNLQSNNFWMAVLGLSAYTSAFVAESIRSGINTVPLGQAEAARSIGLTFGQSLHQVLLPQAFRGAIAPLGNTLVALAKNTTVAAAAGVVEASNAMSSMIEMRADLILPIFLMIATGWVIIVLPLGIGTTWASRKLAVLR